jgi:hypothetical protein
MSGRDRHQFHGAECFFRSWQSLSWSINSPPFTEPGRNFSCSSEPATGPCPDPVKSFHTLTPYFFRMRLSIVFSLHVFRQKFCTHFSSPPCLVHHILLDLITPVIFSEEYKLRRYTVPRSSCYNFFGSTEFNNLHSKGRWIKVARSLTKYHVMKTYSSTHS